MFSVVVVEHLRVGGGVSDEEKSASERALLGHELEDAHNGESERVALAHASQLVLPHCPSPRTRM